VSLTIGVDIGGTKVLGGVVDAAGQVVAQTRRHTPADDVAQTLRRIVEVVTELAAAHRVEAIGVGAAGWIDASRSTVLFAPNLAWRNEPLRAHLARVIDRPVVVENDANAAAWAEFRFGAAREAADSMVMLTLGTGIGGGIVLGGEIVRGAHGMAAEYASGTALVRYAQAAAKDEPGRAGRLLELAGGNPGAITGTMVTTAATAGDEAALGAFAEVGRWLGTGLADLVQILDPQVLVIGGGVVHAGELLLEPARAAFAGALGQRGQLPVAQLRAARMGNLAGVVGAADLVRRR
jgi:glucokinase